MVHRRNLFPHRDPRGNEIQFDAMKRNRSLWVELSDKLKNQFGHADAVRWKDILAAYKKLRQRIKNNELPSLPRIYAFYKDVELVVGDSPIPITALTPRSETIRMDDASSVSHAAGTAAAHAAAPAGTSTVPPVPFETPTPTRVSPCEIDHAAVINGMGNLRSIVESYGQTLQRIGRMLSKEIQVRRWEDSEYGDTVLLDDGSDAVVEMYDAVAAEAAAQAPTQATVEAMEAAVAENEMEDAQAQAVADVAGVEAAAMTDMAEATAAAATVADESHEVEHEAEDQSQGPATKKAKIEGRFDS